jgi:GTPase KRas protein
MPEYKIVVLGWAGVGKSCLTIQFVQNRFVLNYDPTLEDAYQKVFLIDEEYAVLNILDTSGQDEFSGMRDAYMRSGEGFLLVYAINSHFSFEEVVSFREQALRVKDTDFIISVLVGNKCDLSDERQVSKEEGEELARRWQCPFFETSAKLGNNVKECFFELVREIRKRRPKSNDEPKSVRLRQARRCYIL